MGKAVMKIINILGALAVSAAALTTPALAAEVEFNGTVGAVCILKVQKGGQLGVKTDYTELNSSKFGGAAGAVEATTNGPDFQVKVTAPDAWDVVPTDYTGATEFRAQTTVGGVTDGAKKPLAQGVVVVPVNMAAKATTVDQPFTYGDYAATVVVTCEK